MKARQNSKQIKTGSALRSGMRAPHRTLFRWTTLLSLLILIVGLLASAQEIPCGRSAVSDSPDVRVHASNQHSEHCIRHQAPLPGFDSAPQTVSAPGATLAKIVIATLPADSLAGLVRAGATAYDYGLAPHSGVSVYKIFDRFLI